MQTFRMELKEGYTPSVASATFTGRVVSSCGRYEFTVDADCIWHKEAGTMDVIFAPKREYQTREERVLAEDKNIINMMVDGKECDWLDDIKHSEYYEHIYRAREFVLGEDIYNIESWSEFETCDIHGDEAIMDDVNYSVMLEDLHDDCGKPVFEFELFGFTFVMAQAPFQITRQEEHRWNSEVVEEFNSYMIDGLAASGNDQVVRYQQETK